MSKKYGLIILPHESVYHPILPVSKSHSVFNEDSDSDTPTETKPTGSQSMKKQDKMNQKKAIEEDPTVYQYDEIYDEMDQQRKEFKLAKKDLDRKPKYINRLLATAEKRKRENERRIERQVQKEREQEGDMYKDKESFVTSAYKKKLEELKKLEEEEKREEYLESIGDVRKQGNLDGFYRHLYDQKINYTDKQQIKTEEVKKEPNVDEESEQSSTTNFIKAELQEQSIPLKKDFDSTNSSSNSDDEKSTEKKRKLLESKHKQKQKKMKVRNYRSRKDPDEDSDKNDETEIKMEHLPSNIDADSDFSIDSSDSEDENTIQKSEPSTKDIEKIKEEKSEDNKLEHIEKTQAERQEENPKLEELPKMAKPKLDIWKKRTVGQKFDEAVQRYFERKGL